MALLQGWHFWGGGTKWGLTVVSNSLVLNSIFIHNASRDTTPRHTNFADTLFWFGSKNFQDTAVLRINQSEAILWSKMLILKRAFHNLRVLPHLCLPQNFWQLMRALKWGTTKGFPSRDIRMVRGQSYRLLTLLNKKSVLKNF